jgi:hypothetical protein
MKTTRGMRAALVGAFLLTMAGAAVELGAQGDKYSARLAWVPIAGADRVTGKGSATAALSGKTLAISGSFEGLGGPATIARLHQGVAKGARGKPVADVTVPKTTSGTFSASVVLTDEQIEALKQGKLYLQLNGDKGLAPDGANLWGWFQR